jgi:hypothetical protein
MPVVNRRNAVVGYFVVLIVKRALWRRAKAAADRDERRLRRPLIGAAALIALSAAGAAIAWRLRSGDAVEDELP